MKMIYLLLPLLLYGMLLQAQTDTPDLRSYLQQVEKHNAGYAAEKFNMDIADANVAIARVFPDPELSAGVFDNGQRRHQLGNGYNSSLAYNLELGGKRKARMAVAVSEREVSRLLLEDYFRNLRADATLAFLQAIHQSGCRP